MKPVGIQRTALVIVLVVLVSACGGGGETTSSGEVGVSTTAEGRVQRPRLEKLLAALKEIKAKQAPPAAIGPRYTGTPKVETIEDFMTLVLNEVNGFWFKAFNAAGLRYDAPQYVWVEPGTTAESNCGPATSRDGAFYCPGGGRFHRRDRIYVGVDWMFSNIYEAYGDNADFAVASVIAHEMGHHVQREIGVLLTNGGYCCGLASHNIELHADCLSGMWAHSAYGKGQLQAGDIEEATRAAASAGDTLILDPGAPGVHGTARERVAFFRHGYDTGNGPACDAAAFRPLGSR
jgi:predicted metalloprotease